MLRDFSIKVEGTYRLQFDLYEMQEGEQYVHICGITSQPFHLVSSKSFHNMPESTGLTRTFIEQGVQLRLRKEPRSLLQPKGPRTDDYKPRQYRTNTYTQASQNKTIPSPMSPIGSAYNQGLSLDSQEHQLGSSNIRYSKQLGRSYSYHAMPSNRILANMQSRAAMWAMAVDVRIVFDQETDHYFIFKLTR